MNLTAHSCPDCGTELFVDDNEAPQLVFECSDCFSVFYGIKFEDAYVLQGRH